MTMFNVRSAQRALDGFHPDPSICRGPSGALYMVNSTFEYFPGLPVSVSDDGLHWRTIGDVVTRPSQFLYETMDNNLGMYAPTIRYHEGLFYVIVANVNVGTAIYTASDPVGPWSDPLEVEGWPGIDPSLLFDDDGSAYICGNEGQLPDGGYEPAGIYVAQLDVTSGRLMSGRTRICRGITGAHPEGPHLYKRSGLYYLMWAEGGTEAGHMENIARSSCVTGPYENYPGNPLVTNRSTPLPLQAVGHADCADFEADRTVMAFLATRGNDEYPSKTWLGRESYVTDFTWKDGWPDLCDQSYDCPDLLDGRFDMRAMQWITPSVDRQGRYALFADDGEVLRGLVTFESTAVKGGDALLADNRPVRSIRVQGLAQDFTLAAGPPLIGVRQPAMVCDFGFIIDEVRQLRSGSCGLAVYVNARHYFTLGLVKDGGADSGYRIEASTFNDGLLSCLGGIALTGHEGPVELRVHADQYCYRFEVAEGGHVEGLGSAPVSVLAFANAGGFTGVLLGAFVHGEGTVTFRLPQGSA